MNTTSKSGPPTHALGTLTRTLSVLFCLQAKEARTKQGECKALVVKRHVSKPRHRLRPLPATPLVVRRRYLIVVPRPLPAAPLVVRRRCLIAAPRPLPAEPLVVCRRYLIVVLRPMPAAPCSYLIVVPRLLPAAPLVVRRR
jgi:hypothetical protein